MSSLNGSQDSPLNALLKAIESQDGGFQNYQVVTRNTTEQLITEGTFGALSVTSAALACVSGTNKAARKLLVISPQTGDLYWGFTSAVTTSTGMLIERKEKAIFQATDACDIYIVSASTNDVRIIEA